MSAARALVILVGFVGVACTFDRGAPTSARIPPSGLRLEWTSDACRRPAVDRDADAIDDACELALARAFAPELVVDPTDCSWDESGQPRHLGGGYLFAVQSAPDRRAMRIAYLPAYFRDCGWNGLPCMTRRRGCSAHPGDSELIAVDARYDEADARWRAEGVFLSAHCFGRSAGRCRWYRDAQLAHFGWVSGVDRGAPRVWVARGKHANYPSQRECDTGHWYYDSCDGKRVAYRFPIRSQAQNVGSRERPLVASETRRGCLAFGQIQSVECFWDPTRRFRGWQGSPAASGATPYSRVLAAVGF